MSAAAEPRMPLSEVLNRWDELVERWNLNHVERSGLIGGCADGPVTDIETYRLLCGEQRIRLVVEFEPVLVRTFAGDARICDWLRRPNANLGKRTPIEVMACSPEWMRWLIDNVGLAS